MQYPKVFKGIALIVSAACFSLVLGLAIMAWTEPGAGVTPPDGNVNAPVNVGAVNQTKIGDFTSNGKITAPTLCIGSQCRTSWPSGQCPSGQAVSGIDASGNFSCVSIPSTPATITWLDGSCGEGSCGATQRLQYNTVNNQTKCVSDSNCKLGCTVGLTNGCGKCNAKGTAFESTCTGSNDVCGWIWNNSGWVRENNCSQVQYAITKADCSSIEGWICDNAVPSTGLWIEFYQDTVNSSDASSYLGWSGYATLPTADASKCSGNNAHGFKFTMPAATTGNWPVHDGQTHKIYMAARRHDSSSSFDWFILPTLSLTCAIQ